MTYVFVELAASQRRGLRLRYELERTVSELKRSRQEAPDAAATVRRLANRVAHENPLAAVKGNVHSPRHGVGAERNEVVHETLAAVDRIARIVRELRQGGLGAG